MKQLTLVLYLFIFIAGLTTGIGITYTLMDKDVKPTKDTTAEVIRNIDGVESERAALEGNATNAIRSGERGRYGR